MYDEHLAADIRAVLASIEHRDCATRVQGLAWELTYPSWLSARRGARTDAIDAAKRRIVARCAASATGAYIAAPFPEDFLKLGWPEVERGIFGVPASSDASKADYALFTLGDWQLWVGPLQASAVDTFRQDPDGLERWFRSSGCTVFVDSFHDDMAWLVLVSDGERAA